MKNNIVKKIIITLIISLFLSINIAFADNTCNGLLTQEAYDLILEVLGFIRIGVPILLVVLCSADLVGVVTSQDDNAIKKAGGRIVKRFIAAAAFFFVPLIVTVVLEIDAIKNSLNLVDDPTCGIATDTADESESES